MGVSETPRYGVGMGVLGLGVPTVVGSVGWGSERPPDMGWGWGSWGWVFL